MPVEAPAGHFLADTGGPLRDRPSAPVPGPDTLGSGGTGWYEFLPVEAPTDYHPLKTGGALSVKVSTLVS